DEEVSPDAILRTSADETSNTQSGSDGKPVEDYQKMVEVLQQELEQTKKELGTTKKIVFVPVEGEALKKLTAKYPFYVEWKIPKDTYGTANDTVTAAVMNIMLVSKNLSDDVVYDLLEGIYSDKGLETIGASHATAKREIKLETALRGIQGTSVKLHPGAEKFYKDKGILK
ncbi:MAG: TAXI family TRAP transporter solute-binding subunit, partial [Schwartzia sp.]|nr:TAXI family TRAP transporter solute-binding subunit [Schwartzia sp. (in: firmicutes)]